MLALTRRVPSVFLSSASLIVNQGSIPLFLGGVRWIVEDRWAREPLHQAATKRRHCFTSPNALLRPLPPPTSTLFGQSSPMRKCQRALPLASLPRPLPSLPFPPLLCGVLSDPLFVEGRGTGGEEDHVCRPELCLSAGGECGLARRGEGGKEGQR